MQTRKNAPVPRRRPLGMALATLVSCSAWAAEPTPWYVGVSQSLTHDSNVYRLGENVPDPDGLGRGDNYSSTGLLGGFDQSIGRQRVHAAANIRYNKYLDHDKLNNTSYGVDAGWDWATIANLSGNVNASANQSLAALDGNSTRQTTDRNILKTDQVSTTVRWGGAGRLSAQGDYAHSRVNYSSTASANSDSSADTGSLGTYYSLNPDLRVGGAFRLTRTVSQNGILLSTNPNTYAPNSTNGRNLDLLVDWQSTAQTGVNARISFTRQSNSGATAQDFSGLTGSLSARYAPTAKVSFVTAYTRDAGTNGSFFNVVAQPGNAPVTGLNESSQVADSLSLRANYAATAKTSVNAGYQYRNAKVVNTVQGGGNSATPNNYNDRQRVASLGASWAITRAWQLSCNLSRENRDVGSLTGYAYSANVAACSTQFTLR